MIMWFRNLPSTDIDFSRWEPFIKNPWYRRHYMKFVYLIMISIVLVPNLIGMNLFKVFESINIQMSNGLSFMISILVIPIIFIVHEILHLIVIYRSGNISITFSGIFFWINTDATLSKKRFWLFMNLPIITLSIVPGIISVFLIDWIKMIVLYICWINLIISSSDIINSIIILTKPKKSIFCRGYYRNNY